MDERHTAKSGGLLGEALGSISPFVLTTNVLLMAGYYLWKEKKRGGALDLHYQTMPLLAKSELFKTASRAFPAIRSGVLFFNLRASCF